MLEEEASIEIIDDDQAEPAAIVVEDEEVGMFFILFEGRGICSVPQKKEKKETRRKKNKGKQSDT